MRPWWWAAVFVLMIAACATSRTARTAVPVPLSAPNRPVGELAADLGSRVTNERAWAAILIGERGQVAHAEVRESIPELDAAAVESVREWSFEPAKRRGKPTPTMALAPVTFRIY